MTPLKQYQKTIKHPNYYFLNDFNLRFKPYLQFTRLDHIILFAFRRRRLSLNFIQISFCSTSKYNLINDYVKSREGGKARNKEGILKNQRIIP